MKYIVVAYMEDVEKVNPEQFGDWIRAQRKKYIELLKTDKISLLAI
jgi:hypothetical protein